ncbi:TP53-binding protein 1-like isoform X1 [Lytechinus variegatus]|uniref:TP53-binding protein 1-like isoform X1 n=1 Tax=Lytechinus variegatus TaxID=7654 RepID=UPI001BB13B60|nr:TP53-binding protein 1-like isoform X1 [Lytechinus variegatus]
MDLNSQSQDHSDNSGQGGLPDVSNTPCFIVLDSQAEGADASRGSITEDRTSRLKQLEELSKNSSTVKPSIEMELVADVKSSKDRKDDKKVSSSPTAGMGIQTHPLKDDKGICEEEEDDDEEVTSTQDDLFDEEKKVQVKPGDFHTLSASKEASQIGTSSQDVHSTQKDASHLICTPSETVGSLRFSGVVLANETSTSGSGSSINVVFPSPEAYGPAPIIIPSTPTRPDTSNEDPIDLSDTDDMPRGALPQIPIKRKSTTTSDESEDICKIPAWQQELNLQQKRKEVEAGTQDSWNDDNTGSKKRSLSASIDSANPSSEHSESIHKSSLELQESLLQQQQPPMPSTTDESSVQSTCSKIPIGSGRRDRESHSAPLLSTTARDGQSSSGSHPKKPASLPEGMTYDTKRSGQEPALVKELSTQDQSTGMKKTSSEAEFDDRTRLGVKKQEKGSGDAVKEAVIEIIDDDDEEDGDKGEVAEVGMDVEPSDDWHLRLSPSQTQTQYSFVHSKDIMSQRDPTKDIEEGDVPQQQKSVQSNRKGTVSRQATPWHSTQADDGDDEVAIVIPESEKQDENKENESTKQKISDPDDGVENVTKEGLRKKLSESGEGMEDSVFLEGNAQLSSDARLRFGQLGESDNPSPITGFNLSVPKDGAMLRPLSSMTSQPSKKGQWTDGTPRHSTPKADEIEGTNTKREVAYTPDKETPKTSSKSSSALVVSAVIDMDSAESSEIPVFNLRNPADCDELLKEVKESPSKKRKSVFSRVVEATKTAKSNTKSRKLADPIDKDPFSLSKPKTKLILGKKRNQQSLTAQDDQPRVTRKEARKEEEMGVEIEHADEGKTFDVAMDDDDDDPATIPLEYHPVDEDPKEDCPDVEVVEESRILKTKQEETQRYGGNDEQEADVEMDIDAEEEKIDEDVVEERMQEGASPKEHQVVISQERRRRDPYEFTESQSNKTPTPMKTWARKDDTVPKEKLPSRNLEELSSTKQASEQPSTSAVTPKSKKTPRGSRQTRSAKRKRPQDLAETTEEERENENSRLNRTGTSPRKASSTVRKAPRKRGKAQEKQVNILQMAEGPPEKPPNVRAPSMTERVVQDTMAPEQRPQASPASLELIQIPGHSPPARQLIPWKIVRYKKVNITQRIKEVIENGELIESTILDQVVNEEIVEKLEQEFRTPSPTHSSKTSSVTSGSLADISSFGSRTSSSVAGSLQKTSSNLSIGIQKSISLSSISERNSSLDKTISLPGSEKTSPNVSGHEHSASGRQLTSPGGVVQQAFPARGIRQSPTDNGRRSLSGGAEHLPGITEESSRTGQARSPDVSPSALMLSNRKRGKRVSSKGTSSSSVTPSDAEVRMVSDEKDCEFAKPKRTPSRRSVPRTPNQADQSTHEQSSKAQIHSSPTLNVSEGWNVEEVKQSSEESEGIPCAQPRKELERISSDEKSDGDVGKLLQIETTTATSTTGESFEDKVDEPGPSNRDVTSTRPARGKRRGKTQKTAPIKQSLDDTIVVQDEEEGEMDAILTEPPLESRQRVSTSSDPTTDSAQAFLVPGVRVFTRWLDGFYYPGIIKSEEKNNRLKIAFDDGDMRSVNSKDVIIKDWLARGQSVMAELPEDQYSYPGIVIGYYRGSTPKDDGYYIETDDGKTEKFPREKVILSKDQANLLLTSCPSSSSGISDITLENLVDGPRHRSRLRAPDGDVVVRTPSKVVGRTPKRLPSPAITRSGGKRKADDKQSIEGAASPKKKAKQLATRLLTTVVSSPDISKQGIGVRRSPRKQTPSTSTASSPAKSLTSAAAKGSTPSTPRTMEMILGPMPNNKTLFKGMAFLLTQGEVKKRSKVDTSTSDSEGDDDPDDVPFNKDYSRRQIEAGGGVVFKDIEKSQRTEFKLFVIANTYCRTMKYMYALAANIPCISNLWIRDCSRMNKLQSHKAYRLQAGESVDGDIIEWKPNRMILSGLKVLVLSSYYRLESTWRSILMAAGCHIVARFPTINQLNRGGVPFDCNVMVTDPSCPRHILHRAQQLDMPVVSAEWVMQSLINGVRMPYDSHYKFAWDYREKIK